MKKMMFAFALLAMLAMTGCGSDSPESIAKKWCDMNAKIEKAEGEERDKLIKEQREFEKSVEEKHKGEEDFMDKIRDLTRACDN
ncbi:MAG: hypothetical protein U0176_04195 [Bacteroidia bacterium]